MDGHDEVIHINGSKGKGKAKETTDNSASGLANTVEAQTGESKSIFSRITDSATGLGNSLLNSRPTGGDLEEAASAGKAHSARQHTQSSTGESSSAHKPVEHLGATSPFRHGDSERHAARQEQEFSNFLDNTNVSIPEAADPALMDTVFPVVISTRQTQRESGGGLHSAMEEQKNRDGREVVALLESHEEGEDDFLWKEDTSLSERESTALQQALFGGDAAPSEREWDHVLNFVPEFVRPDAIDTRRRDEQDTWKSTETRMALGLPHSPEVARVWVEQWQDVLTRYTDEVWGDLEPLVQKAREELKELEAAQPDGEKAPPSARALLRLRQILGHLRHG